MKVKIALLVMIPFITLMFAPKVVASKTITSEPSFDAAKNTGKQVSRFSLEEALASHSLEQVTHGLLLLSILGLLASKKPY